jgi:hypothetical protein
VPQSSRRLVFDTHGGVEPPRTIDTGGFQRRGQESQDTPLQAITRDIITTVERDRRAAQQEPGVNVEPTPRGSEVLARVRARETRDQIIAGLQTGINPDTALIIDDSSPLNSSPLTMLPFTPTPPSPGFILQRPSTPFLRPLLPHLTPRNYFQCINCSLNRHVRRRDREDVDECVYDNDEVTSAEDQQKYCIGCTKEKDQRSFIDDDGIEHEECNDCRAVGPTSTGGPTSTSGPISSNFGSYLSSLPAVSQGQALTGMSFPGPRDRAQEQLRNHVDPPLNTERWADDPALNETDWRLLQDFYSEIEGDEMDTCDRCNRRWFSLNLKVGADGQKVCTSCINLDKDKKDNEPFLFSTENHSDPGELPHHLPELTSVEEMLIAQVHCFMEVRQHRGVQFKYKGHVVNFLQDVGKIYNKLPLLPKDLDIIILRPANSTTVPRINQQFRNDYRVRRHVIES